MAGFVGDDQVRRVREAIDLVQLMGDYATVKRSGNHHTCCCPFHQERTPSLHLYDDGHYHCFGCGAHGDAITLVREKEHLDFADALELLARRAGIELVFEKGGANRMGRNERDQLLEAHEMATRFYEHVLWETAEGAEARAYLLGRGLSEAVIRRFRLGWAPGHGALMDEARRRRIADTLLAKLDLAIERNGRLVDRFYERVTFPIADRFGHPIAFSCRLLPAAERANKEKGIGVGKYVNSTDTPLYHKGSTIFNLHIARPAAKEKGRLIVMEGPTDVMAANDAGHAECVAVMGTALTPEHAKQLGGIASNGARLLLVFDGDRAGQTNSLKAVRTCLSVGVPCWVASVPDGLDPSELLKEEAGAGGKERFEQVLAAARSDVDHLLRALAPRPYELEHRDLLAVADQLLEVIRPLQDRELRDLYLRDVATWLNFDRVRLERRLAGAAAPAPAGRPDTSAPDLSAAQDAILHLLLRLPGLRGQAFDELALEPSHFPATWRPIVERMLLEPEVPGDGLLLMGEQDGLLPLKPALFRWFTTDPVERFGADDAVGVLRASVNELRLTSLQDELHQATIAIAEAEKRRDFAEAMRLNTEKLTLKRALADLTARFGAHR
jgi:DNA primase